LPFILELNFIVTLLWQMKLTLRHSGPDSEDVVGKYQVNTIGAGFENLLLLMLVCSEKTLFNTQEKSLDTHRGIC
jgi:hypothetical protein